MVAGGPPRPGPKKAKDMQRHEKSRAKLRETKNYYCGACDLACASKSCLDKHMKLARHLQKAAAANSSSKLEDLPAKSPPKKPSVAKPSRTLQHFWGP
jgi:hypothetical protein